MSKAKHTFFCADLNYGVLNDDESFHASRVMRLTEGDHIQIVNGRGRLALAKITSASKNEIGFEIIREIDRDEHPLPVHVAIAPTKNIDRFSFFLEKATEMGVKEITPIITANSERRVLKTDKLKKNMIAAIKQSGNLYLPKLNEPEDLDAFLKRTWDNEGKFIAHCEEEDEKISLSEKVKELKEFVILIGPEGDFTPEEVILAKENGFLSVSLGRARFRTETAGILACHTVYVYLQSSAYS